MYSSMDIGSVTACVKFTFVLVSARCRHGNDEKRKNYGPAISLRFLPIFYAKDSMQNVYVFYPLQVLRFIPTPIMYVILQTYTGR